MYAIHEAHSELFADDLSGFIVRDEVNLRNSAKVLNDFHAVSVLATYLDNICIVPVGDLSVPNYW